MSWDFSWTLDGTALSTYCSAVTLADEYRAPKRGRNHEIKWRQGERATTPKYFSGTDFALDCVIRYTNSAGVVTHSDGAPGHAYENLAALKKLFSVDSTATLKRTAPDLGIVETEIEVLGEVRPSQARHVMRFICRMPTPFWKETTATTDTDTITSTSQTQSITVDGDVAVHDPVITVAPDSQNVSNPKVTVAGTGHYLQYAGTIDAGDSVVFDVGARTVTHSVDGAADSYLTVEYADWLTLPLGTYNLTWTCDAGTIDYDVTVVYNQKRL